MNTGRASIAVSLSLSLVICGLGCTTSQRFDTPRHKMSIREAQAALVTTLSHMYECTPPRDVRFTRKKMGFKLDDLEGERPQQREFVLDLANLGTVSLHRGGNTRYVESNGRPLLGLSREWAYAHHINIGGPAEDEECAMKAIDALLVLKEAALAPNTEEADFAAFSAAAKTWLAAEARPPMSDDARSSKAMAEDAFKRKDFTAAMDAYVEALGRHPMWPEGHYNAALLAGEVEDYDTAARHMRRYLVLAPDAKDATAAKDKFLLWQRKAKQ